MAAKSVALRAAAVVLVLAVGGLALAGRAYADHESRFHGQGGPAVDIVLLTWTVVGSVLALAVLVAVVRLWERRDEAAARRAESEARWNETRR